MTSRSPARMTQLALNLARSNPEFALRVTERLQGDARRSFMEAMAQPVKPVLSTRPGLKKCAAKPAGESQPMQPMSLELFRFARSVSRVAG